MLTRPLLAGIFIASGLEIVRSPESRAERVRPFVQRMSGAVPMLPDDPVTAVRINAIAQLAAGSTLALGILPRLSALALATSLVATTVGAHGFWEFEDAAQRGQHQIQFLKNAAILGGLLNEALG